MNVRRSALLIPVALLIAACAAPAATTRPPVGTPTSAAVTSRPGTPGTATTAPTSAATTAPTSVAPSPTTATATASAAPSVVDAELVCGPVPVMPLKNSAAGRLTLSTDIPAFPPWWGGNAAEQYPNEPADGSEWSTADFSAEPYSMEGFESATAYAIAEAMGFTPDLVDWIPNAVFENAFAPGDKPFDFHMAQISITEDRAEAVDFTDPYLQANQALLAISDTAITSAASIADLQGYTLGAGRNTTSLELIQNVIQPTVEERAFRNNADARTALQNGQIDGLVVDLSTAFFMRDAQLENAVVVGQFSPELQADPVGAVLQLDSPLTECVNAAIAEISANGTLQAIYDQWIVTDQAVPFFE